MSHARILLPRSGLIEFRYSSTLAASSSDSDMKLFALLVSVLSHFSVERFRSFAVFRAGLEGPIQAESLLLRRAGRPNGLQPMRPCFVRVITKYRPKKPGKEDLGAFKRYLAYR